MDPRHFDRTPSPGQPLHAYQLQDGPYRPQQAPIQMPMGQGDRLALQPTYSVQNMGNSYDHNEQYEEQNPVSAHDYGYGGSEYALSPEAHHDQYFTEPYEPHPQDQEPFYDDNDHQPILHPDNPYGPNPQSLGPGLTGAYEGPQVGPTPSPVPIRRWKTVKEVQL